MFKILSSNKAKFFFSDIFSMKIIKYPEKRFSFSVSKKISKSAVVRNKLRRWGYNFMQKNLSDVKMGVLAVFYFKKLPNNRKEVEDNINYLISKSGLKK